MQQDSEEASRGGMQGRRTRLQPAEKSLVNALQWTLGFTVERLEFD